MVCNMMDEIHEEDQDVDFEDSFDDFGEGQPKEKKGLPKIAIIGGAVLLIIIVILMFGGSDEELAGSVVRGGSTVKQEVGTEELDPNMVEALETLNEDQRNLAEDGQTSFIPVPIAPSQDKMNEMAIDAEAVDPLETWKAIQNERVQQERFQQSNLVFQDNAEAQQRRDAARQAALTQLAEAMSTQMVDIALSNEIKPMSEMKITLIEDEVPVALGVGDPLANGQFAPVTEAPAVQIIAATTIEYAQTLTEANSDVDGPVLAELVTGPLAGARLLGTFSKEEEYLVIEFTTAVKDGKSYQINAIVLDPETTLPAVVTDVDRRWFRRVILPAAAGFIEGLGSAIAETAGTTVSVEGETVTETTEGLNTEEELGKAFESAANIVAEIIQDEGADVETMVKVRAGTPIGILFLAPVFEAPEVSVAPVSGAAAASMNAANVAINTSNAANSVVMSIQ
ncbi:MAG: DotG/IcmE/VirB10 family protein [Alphaproteobacteria bacterium]|nr:DotG/IcmE/VirB10 family protein [Alphaproteobacteria bacterium]